MKYIAVTSDSFLAHHGILGQKWGVRRYQNLDGTLTAAGRERYGLAEQIDRASKQVDTKGSRKYPVDKSSVSWHIADNVNRNYETSEEIKKSAESLKKKVDDLASINNEMFDSAEKEAKAAIKSQEFKKEFEKKLYENFGDGCDDEEMFEWTKRDIFDEIIFKYCPNYIASKKKFDKLSEEYFSDCKKEADSILKNIGDKRIAKLKDDEVKYSDIVDKLIYYESGGGGISRLFRHPEETFEYATEDIGYSDEFPLPFTMDEYNKKYSK